MKPILKALHITWMVFALATSLHAQNKPIAKKTTGPVPIINREIFLGNPEIAAGQLSPNGKFISFLKPYKGVLNIYVKKTEEPFEMAKQLTDNERPVGEYFWSHDSKYILYLKDKGGDENYNIYAVNPADEAIKATGIPASRNLTPNDKIRAIIFAVSKKNPDIMKIGLNDRDPKWHDLYQLSISTGKLVKLRENKDRISGWVFDWTETARLAVRNPEDGSTEILHIDAQGNFNKVYEVGPLENAGVNAFTSDNKTAYISSNKGSNFVQLLLMDPETGKTTLVEKDPLNRVDLEDASFSDVTHKLQYTSYYDDRLRLYFKDKKIEADYNIIHKKFPGRQLAWSSSTSDEQKVLITATSDVHVPEVYLFDRASKKLVFQYTFRSKLKAFETYLSAMQSVRYQSSDGLEIQAYLTVPKQTDGKPLPLLVFPHGGPWARDFWGLNGYTQLFANRGFIVLSPNFRGSTGFGKSFLDAGNLQWGKLMQDDITWGVKYLISKGMVDPKRVAIMGGSYGGYATLAGLAFTPDLYAAGVDIVGPSNLFTLMASIPPYWEAGRKIFTLRMGDQSTEEGKKILREASPLFSVDKIKAPLLIVQGANDPRVNKGESDQIVIALRDKGAQVDYILADDEGHGFAKPVNNLGMVAAAEKFLAKYCSTRYQESMPDDVAKRLKENTVDISKVVLVKKSSVPSLKAQPALSGDLAAGRYTYTGDLQVQGQKLPVMMSRTVVQSGANWNISDSVTVMGQEFYAMSSFVQGSLVGVKQVAVQGPAKSTIDYQTDSVMVSMDMSGKTTTKTLHPDGLCLNDGAGEDMLLARFPLADGYTTAFYVADGQTQKLKKMILTVVGNEMIGTVNTTLVKLVNDENDKEVTTYYIDPTKKIALKTEQIIPSMMNAKLTMLLQ
jgi:dipeptidyl aminopeptidase/acylaminoacyl peptidase